MFLVKGSRDVPLRMQFGQVKLREFITRRR
jgi:hypothetical protein